MIARIQKRLEERENEGGFTLVELLVVIIIIGILAAIAIPIYLNQQTQARDSAAQADLANYRTQVVAAFTEDPDLDSAGEIETAVADFEGSGENTVLSVETFDPENGDFCAQITYDSGSVTGWNTDASGAMNEGACPAAPTT